MKTKEIFVSALIFALTSSFGGIVIELGIYLYNAEEKFAAAAGAIFALMGAVIIGIGIIVALDYAKQNKKNGN